MVPAAITEMRRHWHRNLTHFPRSSLLTRTARKQTAGFRHYEAMRIAPCSSSVNPAVGAHVARLQRANDLP